MSYDSCNNNLHITSRKNGKHCIFVELGKLFVVENWASYVLLCKIWGVDIWGQTISNEIYNIGRFKFNSRILRLWIPYGHCKFFKVIIMCLLASFRFCARLSAFILPAFPFSNFLDILHSLESKCLDKHIC